MNGYDIRSWRRSLGLTQADLSEALDVDQGTVSRWERGLVEPRPETMRAIVEMVASRGNAGANDRLDSLINKDFFPAFLLDRRGIVLNASTSMKRIYSDHFGGGGEHVIGKDFVAHNIQHGIPEVWDTIEASGIFECGTALMRLACNVQGAGFFYVAEPYASGNEQRHLCIYVTGQFGFPENDRYSLELAEVLSTKPPYEMRTIYRGPMADEVDRQSSIAVPAKK
jgi:transcriptional regulator with XRE-family HTH domain